MIIDLKGCTVRVTDGDGHSRNINFANGNFSWTEHNPTEIVLNRGRLRNADGTLAADVKFGDEQPVDFSFTGRFDVAESDFAEIINGAPNSGGIPTKKSVVEDGCAPYMFKMDLIFDPQLLFGAGCTEASAKYAFSPCAATSLNYSVKDGSISVSGLCYTKTISTVTTEPVYTTTTTPVPTTTTGVPTTTTAA